MSRPGSRTAQYLVWLGSAVLLATAAFHATGWSDVAAAADEAALSPFMSAAVKALWIYASYHWLFVAVLAAIAVAHASRLARIILAMSALLLAVDTVLLLIAVGPFIAEAMLAATIAAYSMGAYLMSPES